MNDSRVKKILVAMLILYVIGSVFFKYSENWSWVDAFYYAAITMTTIGYGDIHPTNDVSKIFSIFFGVTSVGLLFYAIGTIVETRFHKKLEKHGIIKNEEKGE